MSERYSRLGSPQPIFCVFLRRDVARDRLDPGHHAALGDQLHVLTDPHGVAGF